MDSLMDNLTTTEAAVAAGVSLPQINRVIDDRILPDDWCSTSPIRTVRTEACLLISFYFETADLKLTHILGQTIDKDGQHDRTDDNIECASLTGESNDTQHDPCHRRRNQYREADLHDALRV